MADVFISYSTRDKVVTQAILIALESSGISCWIAPRDITPGADWSEAISSAIDACKFVVLIFSSKSDRSSEVVREVHLARSSRRALIPIRIEQVAPTGALRYLLSGVHWLDAVAEPRDEKLGDLVRRIQAGEATPSSALETLLPANPNNLPSELTSFLGRDAEVGEVATLLRTSRVVTLFGPGGVGKTRLALHIGHRVLSDFPDGVWLVELGPIGDASLIPSAIADVFSIHEVSDRTLLASIIEQLAGKRALLIVDNCEHLTQACATVVAEIAGKTSDISILVTTREALWIDGEQVFRVDPLLAPIARPGHVPSQQELEAYPATSLFLDRARSNVPLPLLDQPQRQAVVNICTSLDGIPLALELAAARVRLLSLEQIADRLNARFKLLTTGGKTRPQRQQTLLSLIEWSYDLLEENERHFLRRLGVFAGRFTLDGALAVGGIADEYEGLDLLDGLLSKSLIATSSIVAGERRFAMLETIREFALGKLRPEERDEVLARRLAFWEERSARASVEFDIPENRWLVRLEADLEQIRDVTSRHVSQPESAARIAHIGFNTMRLWHDTGRFAEGSRLFNATLVHLEHDERAPSSARAKALLGAGLMTNFLDLPSKAMPLLKGALSIFEELEDHVNAARTLNVLGIAAHNRGDFRTARELFERCATAHRAAKNTRGEMLANHNLGSLLQEDEASMAEAAMLFRLSLSLAEAMSDRLAIALCLTNLADITGFEGNVAEAEALADRALQIWRDLGNDAYIAEQTARLAWYRIESGDFPGAIAYLADSLPTLIASGNSADIATALVFFSISLFRIGNDRGHDVLVLADDARDASERTRSPFEKRWRHRAAIAQAESKSALVPIVRDLDAVASLLESLSRELA